MRNPFRREPKGPQCKHHWHYVTRHPVSKPHPCGDPDFRPVDTCCECKKVRNHVFCD